MKIYLAAPYAARDMLKEHLAFWEGLGYEVTCSWVNGTRALTPDAFGASLVSSDDEVAEHASGDLDDIDRADALVHYTSSYLHDLGFNDRDHNLHSGGRHVETGYALAKGKVVIYIGWKPENVFQRGLCLNAVSPEGAHVELQKSNPLGV